MSFQFQHICSITEVYDDLAQECMLTSAPLFRLMNGLSRHSYHYKCSHYALSNRLPFLELAHVSYYRK